MTSRELTLENSIQIGVDLGRGGTFRFQQIGSEHQTARYQRFAAGLDFALDTQSAFLFQLEGNADKARADVSFGAELWRTERSAHRLMLTLVDWSEGKRDLFEYDAEPIGLMEAGYHGDPDEFQVVYDVSRQLPLEERSLVDGTVFELERTIAQLELRVPLTDRDRLIFSLDGELNRKRNRTVDPGSPDAEAGAVDRGRLRRREAGLSGRMRIPLNDNWTVEPYLLASYVDLSDETGGVANGVKTDEFQGRIGTPLLYRFSDQAFLRIDLSLQLDELAFGGGAVQSQATF